MTYAISKGIQDPDWFDLHFSFPASISTNSKLVAVYARGSNGGAERFDPQAIIVQRIGQVRSMKTLSMLDRDTPLMDLLWDNKLAEAVPLIEAKVKEANRWLSGYHWEPLPRCDWQPRCLFLLSDGPPPVLKMSRQGSLLFETDVSSWVPTHDGPKCSSRYGPSLGPTYCHAASRMVVAQVDWFGVYTLCKEPFPELRFLSLPRTSCF